MKIKFLNCREIFQNKLFARLIILLTIIFIITSFISEWRISSSLEKSKVANSESYQSIVKNAILLNRCYVAEPDEDYCFAVLKIISNQLSNADFQTNNIKFIWSNCYIYLSSIALEKYPKLHDRWVKIAVNEEVVSGNLPDYTPSTPEKITKFQQQLKAEYREHMQLEISEKDQKLKDITPITNQRRWKNSNFKLN